MILYISLTKVNNLLPWNIFTIQHVLTWDINFQNFIKINFPNSMNKNTRKSKMFCDTLITWDNSAYLDAFVEVYESKPHWTVRCQTHLILSNCYLPDLLFERETEIHGFRSTSPYLIIKFVANWLNLCGLFNAKSILVKQEWYYLIDRWNGGDGGGHTFSKDISPKVKIIAWVVCLHS